MSKGTVAITGVAGFIGSNLADSLLREGYRVIGIDNLAYGVREQIPDGVEFREIDIRNRELADAVRGANVLFHLAAKNCIADCQSDPAETADVNVAGSANVFEAARRANVGKVVYAESSALYEGTQTFPTTESAVAPQSFYALSKLGAMAFAQGFQRYYGMRMTALRYFNVYGPRQDYRRTIPPVMSAFIMALIRGRSPVIYGDGSKRRDFVYVDDVNEFHRRCMEDERTDGHTYNLGSGRNYSVREIYDEIAGLLGVRIEPEYRPDLEGEAQTTLADITAARAVGWEPRVSLREGLERSIAYIRENVAGLPVRADS
jgi:nucleoside-diphosphate-sugar epimerase